MECVFCKIANKKIEADLLYEDDEVVAFTDHTPKAPHHILIIPRCHISTMNDLDEKHEKLLGHMLFIAKKIAANLNIAENGYRVVMNCNQDGGQAIFHIHLHLLGGRQLQWPPG